MKLAEIRKQILGKEKKAKKLHNECTKLQSSLQKQCKHEAVIEVDYIPSDIGYTTPPRRMCIVCGIEEDGWGCGYDKLEKDKNVVKKFSKEDRDKFYSFRGLKSLNEIVSAKLMKKIERR